MDIQFNIEKLLELSIEINEADKLWLNIHRDKVINEKHYECFFRSNEDDYDGLGGGEVVYNIDGFFDSNYLERDAVPEVFYLIRKGTKLIMINNVVDSTLEVEAENFDVDELNKVLRNNENFEIAITSDLVNWSGRDWLSKIISLELDKTGINIKINLNIWEEKYKSRNT